MSLDWTFIRQNNVSDVKINLLDSVGVVDFEVEIDYADGETFQKGEEGGVLSFPVEQKDVTAARILFLGAPGTPDCAVFDVSLLKNGSMVGSSVVQDGSCELKLLKYKVELPRGAKVTLFNDESVEAKFLAWDIPCPTSFPNMTFLQVKAANGFEKQITPSAGSQSFELFNELGRRYAVFGEIWSYSFAQTLWFADLRIQTSDSEWQVCIPTAGEGGTIVTALPL